MSDLIEMTDRNDLIAALIAQYPALEDREQFAALWVKFNATIRYLSDGPIPFGVVLTELRLKDFTPTEANKLAEIDLKYDDQRRKCQAAYAQEMREMQEDLERMLVDFRQTHRLNMQEAIEDIMRDRDE